jgi:hypothetical protein
MRERELGDSHTMLTSLRSAIPFLNEIPDEIYFGLDTAEFHLPLGDVADARRDLEQQLDQHVMTYNRNVFNDRIPLRSHLCANIAGAELNGGQSALLNSYETRVIPKGVSFVVYKKPLQLITPEESAMGRHKVTSIGRNRFQQSCLAPADDFSLRLCLKKPCPQRKVRTSNIYKSIDDKSTQFHLKSFSELLLIIY